MFKWILFAGAAYVGLQYLRDHQLNAAVEACGGIGSAGSLDCAGYKAVEKNWAWFPSMTRIGGL